MLRPGFKKNKEPDAKDTVINYRTVDRVHDQVSDRFIDPRVDPRIMEQPRLIDPRMIIDPRMVDPRLRMDPRGDPRVDARLMELNQQVEMEPPKPRPITRMESVRIDGHRPDTRADLHVRLREPSRDRNGELKVRLEKLETRPVISAEQENKEKYVEKYLENLQRERANNNSNNSNSNTNSNNSTNSNTSSSSNNNSTSNSSTNNER